MRYPASEKAEIIRLVELGIPPRATFYRWYDRYRDGGPEALADHRSRPDRVWNRIPDDVRRQIIDLALELPELSPRELAVRFTDEKKYFVSEASVYRLLKAHDLITSPAYVVIKAANEFKDKTTAINQLWQTDFTYLKITGWGWYYLSTVLDDFSRYIVAWKLCPTMCASDVTETLDLALAASGLDRATVVHRPRLLSDRFRLQFDRGEKVASFSRRSDVFEFETSNFMRVATSHARCSHGSRSCAATRALQRTGRARTGRPLGPSLSRLSSRAASAPDRPRAP